MQYQYFNLIKFLCDIIGQLTKIRLEMNAIANTLKMIGFVTFIGLIIIIPSSLLTSVNFIEGFDYPIWISFFTGITSLTLAVFYSNRDAQKEKQLLDQIKKLDESLEEIKKHIQIDSELQQSQNKRLYNIENELKIFQKKHSNTSLLSIFISRKKWE